MVKRYAMEEPVTILYSERLFDEMAADEIQRVIASPASAQAKEQFIDTIYKIRVRTYHPDWCKATGQEAVKRKPAARGKRIRK